MVKTDFFQAPYTTTTDPVIVLKPRANSEVVTKDQEVSIIQLI